MAQAQKEGKTCIDCHKGIAHLLPKEYVEDEE
jgi:cytochrome c-type protein NapC